MPKIKYSDGYKYQLREDYQRRIPIYPPTDIDTRFIHLTTGGALTILTGYALDFASGPTFDTKSSMQGALVHDALCQLMREGKLGREWFKKVNEIAADIWTEDGMFKIRVWLWKRAIDSDTARAIALKPKKIYTAP